MLTSVAVRAVELLALLLAAGTVTVAAGLWWLRRQVRRLRLTGRVMAARMAVTAADAANRSRRRAWSVPQPDRRWLAAALERRRLWRAVGTAEHAVAAARQVGAPTGDLNDLCRRLRQAAGHADRCLSISRRPGEPGAADAMAEVSDVVAVAALIQDAAASAVGSVARPASASLAEDARREAAALAAGMAAAAGAGHGGESGWAPAT